MAAAAQVKQIPWDDDVQAAMQASAESSPWAMLETFQENLNGAHLWQIDQAGARALLAVRGLQLQRGRILDVVGLRNLGERIRAADFAPVVEHLAREVYQADLLSMCTRHPHMVRACVRQGWTPMATVLNKPLRTH